MTLVLRENHACNLVLYLLTSLSGFLRREKDTSISHQPHPRHRRCILFCANSGVLHGNGSGQQLPSADRMEFLYFLASVISDSDQA
jgi:hypothetical protein